MIAVDGLEGKSAAWGEPHARPWSSAPAASGMLLLWDGACRDPLGGRLRVPATRITPGSPGNAPNTNRGAVAPCAFPALYGLPTPPEGRSRREP